MTVNEANAGSRSSHTIDLRLLAVDVRGSLLELYMPCGSAGEELHQHGNDVKAKADLEVVQRIRVLYEAKGIGSSKGDLSVHKMARGTLHGTNVVALARKDGRIDVCSVDNGVKLSTFRHDQMKKGIHRWVGLAVAQNGIYGCTSAGHFRFFRVNSQGDNHLVMSDQDMASIELPEPLQQVTFQPASDPTHFAYGGEEIPLSVWNIERALRSPSPSSENGKRVDGQRNANGMDTSVAEENGLDEDQNANGKARKRKRAAENRAKARELLWGECWRARNLPNDSLSLPQRPDINSVAFIGKSVDRLAVGTRLGLIRTFDTQQQRKHMTEHRVFQSDKSPVKGLTSDQSGQKLIASNTSGKLFVLNVEDGSVVNQYKGINGVVTSIELIAGLTNIPDTKYFVSTSADRLVRLHVLSRGRHGRIERKDETSSSLFIPDGVTSAIWDSSSPQSATDTDRASDIEVGSDGEQDMNDDDSNEEEEVWGAMATTTSSKITSDDEQESHESKKRRSRTKRRR